MSFRLARAATFAVAISSSHALAQFSTAVPAPMKNTVTTAVGAPGGFLMGADDCNGAHTSLPPGSQSGVPFTTGTTGTQGQNEANCYDFGSTAVESDVWFDWQASASTGHVSMTTCNGTTVDTKIAVYPLNAGSCPAIGTSLDCNDDTCGLQSSIIWPAVLGTGYTLQLGTFPGAAGGSGTFNLTQQAPFPCGQLDDGTTENCLGLAAGGETGWLHAFGGRCFYEYESVDTAYGTAFSGGGLVPNGNASRIAVYDDVLDCDDPTTGLVLKASLATVVANADTDILNSNPIIPEASTTNCGWVLATAVHAAGEFPGPMDTNNPTPRAWVVGQTVGAGGVLNLDDLNANNVPPLQMEAIGFPSAWLLRTRGDGEGWFYPTQCRGTDCPCGNDTDRDEGGCDNSLFGMGGARLAGGGFAQLSDDEFRLIVFHTPNQPGMFFQGHSFLQPAPTFGDGMRCCGDHVLRCGTYLPVAHTTNTDTGNLIGGNGPPISEIGPNVNLEPGDVRCYQWWYRDSAGPCGTGFNLSNSVEVTWYP